MIPVAGWLIVHGAAASASCVSYCDIVGFVTNEDLLTAVGVALQSLPAPASDPIDINHDGGVTVDELLAAVNSAACGCAAPSPTPTIRSVPGPNVAGTVRLPNGQVQPSVIERLAELLSKPAVALTSPSNVLPAPAVMVMLGRMSSTGQIELIDPAQSTTNFDGTYRIALPIGTSEDTCRFVVQAGRTRAFVTSTSVSNDIDYISETAVRLVLGQVNEGIDLCRYTAQDIRHLVAAVQLAPGAPSGATEDALNLNAFNLAKDDPGVQAALNAPIATVTPTRSATRATPPLTPSAVASSPTATFTVTMTSIPTSTRTRLPSNTPSVRPSTATPTNTPTVTGGPTPNARLHGRHR